MDTLVRSPHNSDFLPIPLMRHRGQKTSIRSGDTCPCECGLDLCQGTRGTCAPLTGFLHISVKVGSLQYGQGAVITLPSNRESFEWELAKIGTLKELDQEVRVITAPWPY